MSVEEFLDLARGATLVIVLWSVIAVIVALPVAALFRVQARSERTWQELARRRAWREAAR